MPLPPTISTTTSINTKTRRFFGVGFINNQTYQLAHHYKLTVSHGEHLKVLKMIAHQDQVYLAVEAIVSNTQCQHGRGQI